MGKREKDLVTQREPEIVDERGRTPLGTAHLTRHRCHQTAIKSHLLEGFTCDSSNV